ncbi:MAG: ABC transporter ATP-binding protein [Oscillospiraceae bacterium]|nr:ABC transporter ATP-binding protein [Oscillospiraceae bacterium]
MRFNVHEDIKVPVFKNVVYAVKLVWKADKRLLLSYLYSNIIDNVFQYFIQSILFLKVLLSIIDSGADFSVYSRNLLVFFGVTVFIKISVWGAAYVRQVSTKNVLKVLNNMVFEKAAELDVGQYENPKFYDEYQRATAVMSSGYFDIVCWDVAAIIGGIISFLLVIGTVISVNPMYLLFLAPSVLVFIIETAKSKAVYKRDREMTTNNRTKAYVQRTVFLKDFSKDMRTSNIFSVMMKRFDGAIKANIEILKAYGPKLFLYSMASTLCSEFIPMIGTYMYAGWQFVSKKALTASGFSVVISAIGAVKGMSWYIQEGFDDLIQMSLYFQNLRDFFEYETSIKDGTKTAGEFQSLEFKNVTFCYPSAKKNSIENMSFKIEKGETVAVVGVNGAGKSTLVKLILRFYDVTEGEILYNGVNIKEYTVDSLRNSIASVFQDYKNFAVSVFENVMCRECSEEDKVRAQKALEEAGVWNKVKSLPNGGDTVLTREFDEDGAGLSGGENQKVSTARLFASDYEIAILDEPSSALDPIAEYKMYENLIKATKEKTVIYISHRLSSAVLSDRVIVIENGQIIESGTHKDLIDRGGKYSEMFKLQASAYEREEGEENV